jgi:hypothetical protein
VLLNTTIITTGAFLVNQIICCLKTTSTWWSVLGSNQSCPKAPDLQSSASPLMLPLLCMVRVEGFEPSISCSQSRRIKPDFPTLGYLEEDVRFELTDPFGPSVFKTDAIGHSANPPCYLVPHERLELSHLAVPASKTGVSANSTNGALSICYS